MGLWSNLKDKIKEMLNRSKVKGLPEAQEYENYQGYEFVNEYLPGGMQTIDLGNGYHFSINSIEFDKQIQHSDGRFTNLMIASTAKVRDGDAEILGKDGADKVVFEVPAGEPITPNILSKIAGYSNYLNPNNQKYSYIGEIDDNPNHISVKMSNAVERYINSELISRFENERNQRIQKQEEANRQRQSEFDASLRVDLNAKMQAEGKIKNNRIQNPYLNRIDNSRDSEGKIYSNYNGININTGDIIRIRNLDKVGKDENGEYLYKCFIANTSREDYMIYNTEYISGNYIPICFTSGKKIEDIVAEQNYSEINSVLTLFSQPQIFNESYYQQGKLNYIGSMNGYNLSDTMRNSISKIENEFSNKMKNRNLENEK